VSLNTPACPDTTAPTVSISSPASGTTYTTAQTVTITASASDNVGVTKVEFYQNGVLRSTDTTSPYTHSWSFTGADNGTHSWTARAYDAANNSTLSSAVSLTVNITSYSSTWSKRFGDTGNDYGYAVATDSEGNIIVAGSFTGTADFGGGPLYSYNSTYPDIFVAKFSPTGAHLWSKSFGGFYDDAAYGVAVDGYNNVVITGSFTGTADFGGGPLTSSGGPDVFVAKYSPSGAHIWTRQFGNTNSDSGQGIAVDGSGNVLVIGYFQNSVNFGGGPLFATDSFSDIFVVKLSSSGDYLWAKAFGGVLYDYGQSIATDSSGNVLITGRFMDSIDLGGGRVYSKGSDDIFIAKYSPTGVYIWSKCLGDTGYDIGYGITVDKSSNNIVLTGRFQGSVDFGGGVLRSAHASYPDVFVAKYSPSGGHLWSRAFGGTYNDVANSVSVDGSGNIILTGYFTGSTDFGGGTLYSAGGSLDIFVAKYSATGNHIWSNRFGDTSTDMGRSVAVDVNGNVIVTGSFRYSVDFGHGLLTANAYNEAFLVKFAP
jgi:uncharacterized protein (AIM24 family)